MKFSFIAKIFALFFGCFISVAYAQSGGQAVIVVNGSKIYQRQVDEAVKAEVARGATDNSELRQLILKDLVFREAVFQDVKKKGLATQPDNEYIIRKAQQNAIVDIWFDQFFKSHPITEADVKAEYDKELAKSKEPNNANQFLVSEIVVAGEAEANDILTKLKSGSDFAALAKEKSLDKAAAQTGGEIGWALPSQFVPAIGEVVLGLSKGKMSPSPIKTDYGWVIVKVNDIRPFKVPPYDEVKNGLAQMMIQAEKQRAMQGLMSTVKVSKAQ